MNVNETQGTHTTTPRLHSFLCNLGWPYLPTHPTTKTWDNHRTSIPTPKKSELNVSWWTHHRIRDREHNSPPNFFSSCVQQQNLLHVLREFRAMIWSGKNSENCAKVAVLYDLVFLPKSPKLTHQIPQKQLSAITSLLNLERQKLKDEECKRKIHRGMQPLRTRF